MPGTCRGSVRIGSFNPNLSSGLESHRTAVYLRRVEQLEEEYGERRGRDVELYEKHVASAELSLVHLKIKNEELLFEKTMKLLDKLEESISGNSTMNDVLEKL